MAKTRTNVYSDQDRATVAAVRGSFRPGRGPANNVTTPYDRGGWEPEAFLKITANSRDGTNWRWTYTLRRMKKTAAGFGGWEEVDEIDLTGFNTLEDGNGSAGVVSGYTLDDGSNGTKVWGLEPIATGTIVLARLRLIPETSASEWHFSLTNIPIVACEAPT